jgi:hypothetical protein
MPELLEPTVEQENSARWFDHFLANAGRQLTIPWEAGCGLSDEARAALIPSLQDFQLGESSEGIHGMARAAAYGERVGDSLYPEAVRLFFGEENRHAAYLARYLVLAGATPIGRSWTDFVFRRIRRLFGLEVLLTVLLTAELIGEVFYRAVRDASGCRVLRGICTQLLRDERQHVRFHVERFALMYAGRPRIARRVRNGLWRTFFTGTLLAVWLKHRRAFRLGGYGFGRYWREAWKGFRRATRPLLAA